MHAKVILTVLGIVTLAGAYVVREGAVRVAVDEQAPGGTHIHLLLPAALVPVGMRFVPDQKLREATAQARPWLPAIEAASQELARLPDSDLVEVRDAEQHVSISKRGALLVIDVQSPRESLSRSALPEICRTTRLPTLVRQSYCSYCCTGVSLAGMK